MPREPVCLILRNVSVVSVCNRTASSSENFESIVHLRQAVFSRFSFLGFQLAFVRSDMSGQKKTGLRVGNPVGLGVIQTWLRNEFDKSVQLPVLSNRFGRRLPGTGSGCVPAGACSQGLAGSDGRIVPICGVSGPVCLRQRTGRNFLTLPSTLSLLFTPESSTSYLGQTTRSASRS